MASLSRPYPFKFFKGCHPQISLSPLLSTWSHVCQCSRNLPKQLSTGVLRNNCFGKFPVKHPQKSVVFGIVAVSYEISLKSKQNLEKSIL